MLYENCFFKWYVLWSVLLIFVSFFISNFNFKVLIEFVWKEYEVGKCYVVVVYSAGGVVLEIKDCLFFIFKCINISCLEGEVGGKILNIVFFNMLLRFL